MSISRRIFAAAVVLALLASCKGGEGPEPQTVCPDPTPLNLQAPVDFQFPLESPPDNPLTVEGVALGRRLFYDPILSGDSTQACASCHRQDHAFSDPRRFSVGIDSIEGSRQAPGLSNAGWLMQAFWDGRAATLEDQATQPVPNEIEMHLPWDEAVTRISNSDTYPGMFCAAFGDKTVTRDRVVKAIGQFERTFISANARYDKWRRGEVQLTTMEQRGLGFFNTEKADCFHCHQIDSGLAATRGTFRRIGLDSIPPDPGRGQITGVAADIGKFKPPTLRNWLYSAPYMHDGRFNTIDEVLAHYNGGFVKVPGVDPLILNRNILTAAELDTLKAFLNTLNDPDFLTNPDLSNPFE